MYAVKIHMDANNIQFTKLEMQIVKYLFKHYKERFNARQLAKTLDINHAHANKLCGHLEKKNLLKKEAIGNAVYFSFKYEEKLAIKFMEYLLSLEEKEFPKWLSVVLHELKKFKECIILGLIFGSSIKNDKFNDIDVVLVYEKNKIKEVNRIKEGIRNAHLIEQPIRYVDMTEKDMLLNKDNKVCYRMILDNLIFYNAQEYVKVIRKCRK